MTTPEKLLRYRKKLEPVSLFLCGEQPKSKEAQDAWVTVLFIMSSLLADAEEIAQAGKETPQSAVMTQDEHR